MHVPAVVLFEQQDALAAGGQRPGGGGADDPGADDDVVERVQGRSVGRGDSSHDDTVWVRVRRRGKKPALLRQAEPRTRLTGVATSSSKECARARTNLISTNLTGDHDGLAIRWTP
ncbi:hypothetical protein GCM10009627_10820 [Curtobacterium herbarum]|uniref:Uncharacterized protein n=1 Tax=Curtobacterium herbarum TaxID=150122 RepID=A0ABN1ZAW7_9MICO